MRYLGRAKPKDVNKDFIVVDIETGKDDVVGSALLGETVYVSWCEFGNGFGTITNDLTEWLLSHFLDYKYDGFILYAHNGFGFDFKRVDWQRIIDYGFVAEFLNGRDGSIKSITLKLNGREWIIRDSLLLIPRKLDDVTKKFAPEHQKLKREKSFDESPFNPHDEFDVKYAIQDSVGLWYAIQKVDSILRERFAVSIHEAATLPGLAFRAFRLLFKQGDRKAGIPGEKYPSISWGVAHAARESYHGGQTIAFRTNAIRDVVSLDANSMYSHVMLNWNLPTGEVQRYSGLPDNPNANNCLCLAVCHIPSGVFPVLKTKNEKGGVGNFRGVVSGWYWLFELEKQRELGGSFEVIECYEWETGTNAANRFVSLCRELRMEDYFGAIGEMAKLLANALYGKFAQQVVEFNLMLAREAPEDMEAIPLYNPATRSIVSGLWQVEGKPSFAADMTHWASFITARARMILTEAIQKAGFENIIYCDTDSVFIERKYLPRMRDIMGVEYGKFKIEKGSEKQGIPFQAIAPKAYLFLDYGHKLKIKNKGIPTRDILKQDGFSRMGEENQSIEFISSNNLMQIIKNRKGYGRKAHRKMATVHSTTNGKIINDVWKPSTCNLPPLSEIRGDKIFNRKTPSYVSTLYDIILQDYRKKEGAQDVQ